MYALLRLQAKHSNKQHSIDYHLYNRYRRQHWPKPNTRQIHTTITRPLYTVSLIYRLRAVFASKQGSQPHIDSSSSPRGSIFLPLCILCRAALATGFPSVCFSVNRVIKRKKILPTFLFLYIDRRLLRFVTIHAFDRRTDGQTIRKAIAIVAITEFDAR